MAQYGAMRMSVRMVLWRERERRGGGACVRLLFVGPGDHNPSHAPHPPWHSPLAIGDYTPSSNDKEISSMHWYARS